LFYFLNNLDSALLLEQNAGRLSRESGNLQYQGFIAANIANIYLMKGNITRAKQNFITPCPYHTETDDIATNIVLPV
jgi:hypothetical protein